MRLCDDSAILAASGDFRRVVVSVQEDVVRGYSVRLSTSVLHKVVICCTGLLWLLSLVGCLRRDGAVYTFDDGTPLAVSPEVEWAVVSVPYAACYEETDYASAVTTHCRRGEVLVVQGRRTVKLETKTELWYAFDAGWIPAGSLAVYPNKLRADNAARLLREH